MFRKKKYDFDLIVIGSGAGGSVGAHHAAEQGRKVAIFEKGAIGGECPNFACVPTKALLHASHVFNTVKTAERFGTVTNDPKLDYGRVHAWKNLVVGRTGAAHGEESFRHDDITLIKEKAVFVSPHEVEAGGKTYSAAKFLIATGSNVAVPPIPGLKETGYLTFKEAVDLRELPEALFILGGGAVACELAQVFALFGSKVTIAIRSDKLLSKEDPEVQDLVAALFENSGIRILRNTSVEKVAKRDGRKVVYYKEGREEHTTEVDDILIATGKTSVVDIGLEKAGVLVHENKIKKNVYLQTTAPHIFIAGDIAGPYLFTHTGYYQSYIAVHNAFSYKKYRPDYTVIPRCVFTSPEVASVGLTEKDAEEKGIRFRKGIAPIAVLGRANTSNEMDGFVKVLTDKNDRIIGGSIVAPSAGELIHQIALAMKLRARASDLASMIVAYPTFSEGIRLACSNMSR